VTPLIEFRRIRNVHSLSGELCPMNIKAIAEPVYAIAEQTKGISLNVATNAFLYWALIP